LNKEQKKPNRTPAQKLGWYIFRVTKTDGDSVVTSRFMENVMAPPFWRGALRRNDLADDVQFDRWQICRFTPPSHVMIEVGVAHAGMVALTPIQSAKPPVLSSISLPSKQILRIGTLGHGAAF
jgi:phenylpropionate dioxygenase-like ring-hydroxylating dioxygenase large terminal subunit